MGLGLFEIACILSVSATFCISIVAMFYSMKDSENKTLHSDDDYDKMKITARKVKAQDLHDRR